MSGGSTESVSSLSGNNTGPPNQQSVSVSPNTARSVSDLDKLKNIIAERLNNYLEHRESSTRLQIDNKLDTSYVDPNNYSNKKRFLIEVYQELANAKNSDDIAKLIKKLPLRAELITDENSRFKETLYEIYDATAKQLYEIDSAKYGDLHTQSNKHFDEQIINSIRKQKDNRKQTTSNGVAGFFKSLYHNGLVNTVNEGFLHNRDKKRKHLQFANHFINQLKNKGGNTSAEDYVQFINQAALIIRKLKDDGDNNAGLDKELQAIQEKIIKRYLIEKRSPEFTAEQKLAIFDALKMNHAIDSPMIKQMSDILKADKILFDNKSSPSIRPALIKMKAEALAEKIKTDANSPERIAKRNQTKVDEFADEFRNSLYAKFTAELAMHSGEIDGTNNAAASGVASGLNVASKLSYLSGIPVLPQICGITAQMVKGIDNELAESSHATAAKSLKSFSHQDKLVYYTVSKVCLRYLEQIQSLDKSEVNEMGKQAAERIVDYIRSGKFKASGNVEEDAEKLAIAITSHEFHHGSLPGVNKSVALEHGAKSHGSAEGIFTKPGIMVIGKDGKPKYYAKDGTSPKYGFILGTKEEVDEWRYVPVAGPSDPHPVIKALEKNQQSAQSALPVSAPTHLEDQQYTKSISDNSDQLSKTLLSNPPDISHTTVDTAKMNKFVPKLTSDTAKQLGNYLENRLNNKRLKIYDTFSDKIKDHNSITNKKSAIRKICHQLANVKTTSEYIDFLKTIKTEADKISDKSSGLKKLLVKIHDETANKLFTEDKNNPALLKACLEANKAFNSKHITEFKEFTTTRNATSSKGVTGFFNGVYNSGLINTVNENLRHKFDLKNNQIRYANYFSDKLNQCKSSDDYTQFIIESSWAINKLGKAGRENADLVKILTASRDETLQRFLKDDRQPPLSLEQKELIRDALRQINNPKDNEILKSIATYIKTIDPNHNEVNLERSEQATEILKHTEANIFATDIEKNNDAKRNQFTETLVAKLYAHTVAALIVESGDIQGNQNATQRTQGALGLVSKIGEMSGIPLYSHVCDFTKHSISGIDKHFSNWSTKKYDCII